MLFSRMFDSRMAILHCFRKKNLDRILNILCSYEVPDHLVIKNSRVMLFSFFHSSTIVIKSYHVVALTPSFCISLFLFFQIYLINNFPIFLVTFFDK